MSILAEPRVTQERAAIAAREHARNLPLALMLVVFGVYLLTMSGHTYSPDEETMLAASQSLVVNGSWALPPSRALVEVTGADGRRYSQYGPGQSVAAVPWVIAGRTIGGLFPKSQSGFPLRIILASYNALIAAGICGLFAAAGMALGYSASTSAWTAAALAFATFLWPNGRTFFAEPLVALCLLGSFYLMLARPRFHIVHGYLIFGLSGALFALAVATKVQYVIALPAFLLYLGSTVVGSTGRRIRDTCRRLPGVHPQEAAAWPVGLALGLVPLFVYNLAIFGSGLTTGYGADLEGTFKTPLYEGAFGLLLSPGKGLLWYALPVAVALWGLPRFARAHRAETAFVAALFVSLVVFFGLYAFWPGDGAWGPRYMIPLLPFVMLPALEGIKRARLSEPSKGRLLDLPVLAVAALLALGLLVNAAGVLVNFDTYINVVNDDATRYWTISASPIVGHLRLLGQRASEWEARLLPRPGSVLFKSGFSYSEGDKSNAELLPRWTTGDGVLQVRPHNNAGEVAVELQLTDHRPPQLPRAEVAILVDGRPVQPGKTPVEGHPASTLYAFTVPPHPSDVTIHTGTWNPAHMQHGARNEDLGIMVDRLTISEGGKPASYSLVEYTPAPPYYPQPRWYYDPGTHHPTDLWITYLAESRMGAKAMLGLALPLLAAGLLCILLGIRELRTSKYGR